MEDNDVKDSFYRDEIEDMGARDYSLEDPMTYWNAEKKTLWKKIMGRSETPFVLMGIGLVVLIVIVFAVFSRGGEGDTSFTEEAMAGRIQRIEGKLEEMELRIGQIAQIQQELELVKNSVAKFDGADASKLNQIDDVAWELASLKKELAEVRKSVSSAAKESVPSAPKAPVAAPQVEKKEADSQAVYHEVIKGDTLYSLGRRYDVSVDSIRKQNGLSEQDAIVPGQKLKIK